MQYQTISSHLTLELVNCYVFLFFFLTLELAFLSATPSFFLIKCSFFFFFSHLTQGFKDTGCHMLCRLYGVQSRILIPDCINKMDST